MDIGAEKLIYSEDHGIKIKSEQRKRMLRTKQEPLMFDDLSTLKWKAGVPSLNPLLLLSKDSGFPKGKEGQASVTTQVT